MQIILRLIMSVLGVAHKSTSQGPSNNDLDKF